MAQNSKTAWDFKLIYPYVVCIISICVMLYCAINFVGSFVDYINPKTSLYRHDEGYIERVRLYNNFISKDNKTEYSRISFEEYNRLMDKELADLLAVSRNNSLKDTIKYLLHILIGAGFYIWHWLMIKRQK